MTKNVNRLIRYGAKLEDISRLVREKDSFFFVSQTAQVLELNGVSGWHQNGTSLSKAAIKAVAAELIHAFNCAIDVDFGRHGNFVYSFKRPPSLDTTGSVHPFVVQLALVRENIVSQDPSEDVEWDLDDHFNEAGADAVGILLRTLTNREYRHATTKDQICWTPALHRAIALSKFPPPQK